MHLVATKHILRYLAGTVDYGLDYRRSGGVDLVGFTDSDWVGSASYRKSTSGCCFRLGLIEYMATNQASCEALWLRKFMVDLFDQELRPTIIHCDNQSCIRLFENPVFHDRSKHIEIRYHFIRDYIQRGVVELQYISTDEQVADILTKSLGRGKHIHFRDKMGVVKNTFLSKREFSNFS